MYLLLKRSAPFLALLGLALGGCQPDLKDDPESSAGQADFARYIAVGNSLTAGYGDNGLYLEGQQNSYPAILAGQFARVGGGAFVQPLFPTANAAGSGYLKIAGFNGASPVITSENGSFNAPTVVPGTAPGSFAAGRAYASAASPLLTRYTGTDNQNLGVPGIRVADITTADYGRLTASSNAANFNPFFERLLSGAASTTYQDYVQERVNTIKPTFFTNWLGNNDVLGYASSGGTAAPLTSVADFTTKYTAITNVLTAGGAKGLAATIPNVVNVPYFTTVPTAGIMAQVGAAPVPDATKAQLTAALQLTAAQAATIRFGLFIQTTNPTTGATVVREATANDLLLLPASSVINTPSTTANPLPRGLGIAIAGLTATQTAGLAAVAPPNPLANSLVLDAAEVTNVQNRTTELNTAITTIANQKGLAIFDSNAFFTGVARGGIVTNTVGNTAAFVSGNLFSLDGVHPTPRGYAVITNEMIKAINAKYGASVPGVDASAYRGVRFP